MQKIVFAGTHKIKMDQKIHDSEQWDVKWSERIKLGILAMLSYKNVSHKEKYQFL